jgi:hypothetical protein
MSLRNVDMGSALRRLADKRIEDAMKEGKFDNLAGKGKPLNLEPMPADEGARMTWWMLRLMKQHDFVPHEVAWRKSIDQLRDQLPIARDESQLFMLVRRINELVQRVNTLGTNALSAPLVGVSLASEVKRLRARTYP